MNTSHEIPSFGYAKEDFSSFPFVIEVKRIEASNRATRNFAHRHTYCHILWLTQGTGVHIIDFEEHPLSPDALFFIGPRQMHVWTSEVPVKGYSIKFSAEFQQRLFTPSHGLVDFPCFRPGGPPVHRITAGSQPELQRCFEELLHEAAGERAWQLEMTEALLKVLLLKLQRQRLQGDVETHPAARPSDALAHRYLGALETHFLTLRSANDYAALLRVTPTHLNAAVKRTTGLTPVQLHKDRLLLEAKRRLMFSDEPISEVGLHLGFEDPSYFSRFFKRGAQVSPCEFRLALAHHEHLHRKSTSAP